MNEDYGLAVRWYGLAGEQGHRDCSTNLAVMQCYMV